MGRLKCRKEVNVSGHKFKIGQLVNYLIRGGSLGVYQVTQLLPPEGEAFQYRIKNANEPHERTAKERATYSVLNSLTIIACSVATPRTACWLSSMIFSTARRVAASSMSFNPKVSQTLSSASDISRIVSGSNTWPNRNGRIGTVSPTRSSACKEQ